MQTTNTQLVLRLDDYKLLTSYLNNWYGNTQVERKSALDLQAELKRARLVDKDEFPSDTVRLNSRVKIKADGREEVMELMLVMPDKADMKERKISVVAPVGAALIGFRKGHRVSWQVPAGKRTFTILEVINE
ncbi:GreA/GreB family elongation factor [Paraflavitalea sp. CAU 1676]|uniref:GreA/GreB family elongation factor n=1 Tax=Paraflavitalea sp. CAU 1676 TaxID=3032598 RepID=UPI0023DCA7CF|nr:GreA/GreB family elongation factor [Paraflavitalea sp. CAU 1676]MDF2190771.1 GreA/GreB family elongation factor [Paraflavitalea sp. CAU 1676]